MEQNPAATIAEHFSELEDPRRYNKRHLLHDIIVIAICAAICGWNVSSIVRQLVLEFRVEKLNHLRLIHRLLHDSLVLVRVKGRFALRP